MNTTKSYSGLYYYIFSIIFFMFDILMFQVFEKPVLYSLLSFYCIFLRYPLSMGRIITACILLSFHSLLFFGQFGIELIYVIPVTLIALRIRHILYDSPVPYIGLFIACLITQTVFIEWLLLDLIITPGYIFSIIGSNTIWMIIVSYLVNYV